MKRRTMPFWAALAAAVVLSGVITLTVLWCQPNALRTVLGVFLDQPVLILLNALPIGLLVLFAWAVTGNVFFGAAAVNLAAGLLSVANRIKIEVRDEPVFPRDFSLLREVGRAMQDYRIDYPLRDIFFVLGLTAVLAVLGVYLRSGRLPVTALRGRKGRAAAAASSAAMLVGLIFTLYASAGLYASFTTTNPYYIPGVYNELGFPYCFCRQFTTFPVEKPDGFDRKEAAAWDSVAAQGGEGAPVHVVMVMNEAFADVTGPLDEDDPLPNLRALQGEENALSGTLVVPNYAAGTANTEFDVLTGIQTNALSEGNSSALRVVNRDLESLFRVFGEEGYHTSYFHPGDDWFYNRENVYDWLGAKETRFIDEMEEPACKGRWVTDDYMAGQIEAAFEAAAAQEQLLFHYTTTIQNHMAYTAEKYGEGYEFAPLSEGFENLTEEEKLTLQVYLEGARDADRMLGRLRDYFAKRSEPVVLVFFGDHLPALGSVYTALGKTEAADWADMGAHEVPYLVWANDAAAALLGDTEEILPVRLSAAFFGAALLELTGRREASPWFAFLNDLRQKEPVIHLTEPEALAEEISRWRCWSYYKLKFGTVE